MSSRKNKSGRGRVAVPAYISDVIQHAEFKRDCYIAGIYWKNARPIQITDYRNGNFEYDTYYNEKGYEDKWRLHCVRCGNFWKPRKLPKAGTVNLPKQCPKCKSPLWNTPRKYRITERVMLKYGWFPEEYNKEITKRAELWDMNARKRVDEFKDVNKI